MATYTIVSSGKDSLDPGEINAGSLITVAEGDVFIIDPTADVNTEFQTGGGSVNFDVQADVTNANAFDLIFHGSTNPTVTLADGVGMSSVNVNAEVAESLTIVAGDNTSLRAAQGSQNADSITLGNNFTAHANWLLLGGDDTLTAGTNTDFTGLDVNAGLGNDSLSFGDGASFNYISGEEGADTIAFGDDLTGNQIAGGTGDDLFIVGANASISNSVDGGQDNDTLNTQTTGITANSVETTNIVCYAPGTLIDTPDGQRAVEDLRPGDLVITLDHGVQPIRWTRSDTQPLEDVDDCAKPVLSKAGALGVDLPADDLIVSPQHRILVSGNGGLRDLFVTEAFVPAKSLTELPGIRHLNGKKQITWVHFACDRHEVVVANGCLSESLLLGPMAMQGLTRADCEALTAIYGPAPSDDRALNGPAARECLKVGEVRRHLAKCKTDNEHRTATDARKWDVDLAMEQWEAAQLGFASSRRGEDNHQLAS